jgi:hypothetical protein
VGNLAAITPTKKSDFVLKFRYRRAGTDPTGTLTVDSVNVQGTYLLSFFQAVHFEDTPFEGITLVDPFWNRALLNALDKLYKPGIVPNFIERNMESGEGVDLSIDDAHYIELIRILAHFFTLPSALSDRFVDRFFETQEFVVEFLRQRSLFLCGDEELEHLLNPEITYKLYSEIAKRGTLAVFQPDQEEINIPHSGDDVYLHGEFLRLICYDRSCDEFVVNVVKNSSSGWYLNVGSPTYTGAGLQKDYDKLPLADSGDLDLATLQALGYDFSGNFGSLTIPDINGDDVVVMQLGGGVASSMRTPQFRLSPVMGYELTFWLRCGLNDGGNGLSVSALGYNVNGVPVDFETYAVPNNPNNNFVSGLCSPDSGDQWLFVRYIIYPSTSSALIADTTNINFGQNLRATSTICNARILFQTPIDVEAKIYDLRLRPLINPNTPGYINAHAFVRVWALNRNTRDSVAQIVYNTRRWLLPYNALFMVTFLNADPVAGSEELYTWLLGNGSPWQTAFDATLPPWLLAQP